ncbi:MAG: 4-hydroxy-3-methylbut-2-enyl diphosphate reductase [bacterium]|nr:4-hydroxy-3-methylbut-2-enyl diphosphate reductase [bacterium]
MKVLLAKPRGYCAGVDRAIDVVYLALEIYGPPVYMRHQIVHNKEVVKRLESRGAIFVEETSEIPEGAVTVFSAHGVPPQVRQEAEKRKLRTIDATCPLVTKVHIEAKLYADKGFAIVLIGHKGHVEMEGTMGEAPSATTLIETKEEARTIEIKNPAKTIILTQTTLSLEDTAETIGVLKKRFPEIHLPPKEDICYATTNRQSAVKKIAPLCDLFLAVGAPESSNTNRLVESAKKHGCLKAYLIEKPDDISDEWLKNVETIGLSAGASAPEDLVQSVIQYLRRRGVSEVEEVTTLDEEVKFTLPQVITAEAKDKGVGRSILEKHRF